MWKWRKRKAKDVFEREMLPHMDALYRYAKFLTKDADAAEDLTQSTLLRALASINKYKEDTNAKAWLFRIMTNLYINSTKKKNREMSIVELLGTEVEDESRLNLFASSNYEPEENLVVRLTKTRVREAIETLPPEFRQVVVLADLEGFSYKEIAEIVGCPIGTVMSRLHRGRRLLKRKLLGLAVELGICQPPSRQIGSANVTSIAEARKKLQSQREE